MQLRAQVTQTLIVKLMMHHKFRDAIIARNHSARAGI